MSDFSDLANEIVHGAGLPKPEDPKKHIMVDISLLRGELIEEGWDWALPIIDSLTSTIRELRADKERLDILERVWTGSMNPIDLVVDWKGTWRTTLDAARPEETK